MGEFKFDYQKSMAKDESENSAAERAPLMHEAEDEHKKIFFNIYNTDSDLDKEMESRLSTIARGK